jgi:plasmid stabilization system protein ParE
VTAPLEIVWSQQAVDDLVGIRDFIARTSPRYAELTVRKLVEAVERLRSFPESRRVVPELGEPSVREVIHGAHRIMYELRPPGRIEALTVFRGSRQFPRVE